MEVIPVNIDPDVPFAPLDGRAYTAEEDRRLMALQPAPKLKRTLVPRPKSKLKPPLFRFGWRLGLDEMERIVLARFQEAVIMVERPPDFSGRDSDGDLVDLPDSQDRTQCASILSTLLSASLMDAIAEHIDLPREQRYLLKLGAMCSSEGILDWGLEVGTNYTTVVPSKYREELKKLLGMTEEPMWYLDFRQWHWREVRTRKAARKSMTVHATRRSTSNPQVMPTSSSD